MGDIRSNYFEDVGKRKPNSRRSSCGATGGSDTSQQTSGRKQRRMAIDNTGNQVFRFNISRNASVILTTLFIVLSLLFAILTYVGAAVLFGGAGILCLLAAFFFSCKIKDSSKTEKIHVETRPRFLDLEKMQAGLDKEGDGFKIYGREGNPGKEDVSAAYVTSEEINEMFVTKPIWGKLSNELYSFPEELLPFAAYLKDDRDKTLSRYATLRPDKDVVGLSGDMNRKLFEAEIPIVEVTPVTRSAVQTTDDAFDKLILNVKKKDDQKVLYDGKSLSVGDDGSLVRFSDSKSANEIDIHSLIMTSDGYLVLRVGSEKHPLAPRRVVSSASASLLPKELRDDAPLQFSMVDCIHNKIRFLYNLPGETKVCTSSCGFARILKRGGAPEFYFLTRIDMTLEELRSFYIDPTCLFVDEILDNTVPDLETVESTAEYIADALEKVRVSSGGNISTSTSALLHVMLDACYNENMSKKVIGRLDTWQEISEKCTGTTEFPLVSSDKEQSDAIQEQG